MVAVVKLREGCGVIKKVKDSLLAFYLLFLARDRFRSFLF
jgi:hypothetical protein